MSSDSTELHFVRCPSCRSLVPASSKTCRMCGAALETGAKSEESSAEPRRSGRVRQRTMSTTNDELNSTVHKIREEMGKSAPAKAPEVNDDGESEDPLSAYIEEIESGEAAAAGSAKSGAASKPSARPEVAPAPKAAPFVPQETPRAAAAGKPVVAAASDAEKAPRVLVESGGRRKGPGLSFGAKPTHEEDETVESVPPPASGPAQFDDNSGDDTGEEEPVELVEAPAPPPRPAPVSSAPPSRPRREEPPREEPAYEYEERRPERREEPRAPERREEPRVADRRDEARAASPAAPAQPKKEEARSFEVPRKNVLSGGRLAGWLVNYRDSDGKAIEIREGKFFVSRSRVKDSDMVIDDRSVSSPHALCAVGVGQRLRVQDLMSDNGVFVRRRDEMEYVRIVETAELEHGDWVKFGEAEYNVCLIAHMGEK